MLFNFKSYISLLKENVQDENEEIEFTDNIKLDFDIDTYTFELSDDKKKTFDKFIKECEKYCRKLQLPLPQVFTDNKKEYFVLGRYKNDFEIKDTDLEINKHDKYMLDILINYDTVTDNKEDIIKKQTEFNSKRNKSVYRIYTTEVTPITLKIVDKIKPNHEWIILGVIDHINGVVKAAPEQQIPTNLLPSDLHSNVCDHCKIERVRNKTVYIKNLNNGEIKCVGGSCIKYYLGYNYNFILKYLEQLSIFTNLYNTNNNYKDYGFGGYSSRYIGESIPVIDIVKYFSWFVKNNGYLSKKAANTINEENPENNAISTSQKVSTKVRYVNTPPYRNMSKDEYELYLIEIDNYYKAVSSEDDSFYKEFIDFVEFNYMDNNFLYNAYIFIKNGFINTDNIEYIVSACSMLQGKKSYLEYKNNKDNQKTNPIDYVGVVGEKMKLENLTVKKISGYESQYGYVNIFTLEDENGNSFVKFGELNPKFLIDGTTEVKEGSKVSFIAEIKEHREFNGKKQTVLGRFSQIKK